MSKVFLSLGSNLGDRFGYLRRAIYLIALHEEIEVIRESDFFENPPAEGAGPDDFINMAIELRTSMNPFRLFEYLEKVEQIVGRKKEEKNKKLARKIDIDILTYDSLVLDDANLKIPHPRMLERGFVMKPLLEIEPDFIHPGNPLKNEFIAS